MNPPILVTLSEARVCLVHPSQVDVRAGLAAHHAPAGISSPRPLRQCQRTRDGAGIEQQPGQDDGVHAVTKALSDEDAAADLADKVRLDATSMRRVADSLRVTATALYKHVANREELIGGMLDRRVARIDVPAGRVPWQNALRARIRSRRATRMQSRVCAGSPHRPIRENA